MKFKASIFGFTESKVLFYLILLFNIILIVSVRFYPSLDGPAHLYNSTLLKGMLLKDQTLLNYFIFNSSYLPNWMSHSMLTFFLFFVPAWLSEKLLIIFYVAGMAFSFRYLVNSLNSSNSYLSLLIFPFIFTFLFHLGFYNFSLGFIFLYSTIGYYIRTHKQITYKNYLLLSLLLLLTYYSNILLFGFLGITLGSYILFSFYINYSESDNKKIEIRTGLQKLFFLLIAALPSLFLAIKFVMNIKFHSADQSYSFRELLSWINDGRPFIVYNYSDDKLFTEQYFHIILILIVTAFINVQALRSKLLYSNFILVPIALSLLMLFFIPDSSGAGMMSIRYATIFYLLLLVWICMLSERRIINNVLIILILLLHIGIQTKHFFGTLKLLNKNAITMEAAGQFIDPYSIVLPVNFTDNWLQHHFSNYAGINKPIIMLENYEASINWFPLKWNVDSIPNITINDKNSISGIEWKSNLSSKHNEMVNNILIYGNQERLMDKKYADLRNILSLQYRLVYQSPDNFVHLFELLE